MGLLPMLLLLTLLLLRVSVPDLTVMLGTVMWITSPLLLLLLPLPLPLPPLLLLSWLLYFGLPAGV
jgi:hypothetical protein